MKIKDIAHRRYLDALNLHRFMDTNDFTVAYQKASEEERDYVDSLINDPILFDNLMDKVVTWTKSILVKNDLFELLDLNYLKNLGRERKIYNFYLMNKEELIFNLRLPGSINCGKSIVRSINSEKATNEQTKTENQSD